MLSARVATGNQVPDHATIARFRAAAAGDGGPLEDLFLQVLFVLAAAGLGRLDVVSVDGSKIWANASKRAGSVRVARVAAVRSIRKVWKSALAGAPSRRIAWVTPACWYSS